MRTAASSLTALYQSPAPTLHLLDRVRAVFFVFAGLQAAWFAARVGLAGGGTPQRRALVVGAAVAVVGLWVHGIARRRLRGYEVALEAALLGVVAVGLGGPRVAGGMFFAGVAYRALFNEVRPVAAAVAAYVAVYLAGAAVAGPTLEDGSAALGLAMIAATCGLLARIVREHAKAVTHAGTLARAGVRLARVGSREQVHAAALDAALAIAGDAARVSVTAGPPREMRVATAAGPRAEGHAGAAVDVVALPIDHLQQLFVGRLVTLGADDGATRAALAGDPALAWMLAVPLVARGELRGLLLVETRAPLADEAVAGLAALGAKVALALESAALNDEVEHGEALFRSLVHSSSDVIALSEADGTVSYLSPSAERLLGAAGTYLGASVLDLVHADDRAHARAALDEAQARPDVTRRVECRVGRDGEWRHCEAMLCALPSHGGAPRLLLSVRDVSERRRAEEALRRAEEQLRQTQKMEAIGRLAGGVAHDFNNLLSVILSYSHLVLDGLGPDDARREDVAEIRNAAERAATLTRQLLVFSRRQMLKPEVLDVNAVLLNLEKMLKRIIGEDIRLETKLEASGDVRVDPGQLEQIVVNLVVNARDAMPDGGTITVRTSTVDAVPPSERRRSMPPGPYLVLSVVDTGCGMSAQTLAHIFEPFFTTKEPGKGTGLGLATVFGAVQQSGGAIDVKSAPGRGSTFTVYLPRVEVTHEAALASRRPVSVDGCETVLLVEDEAPVRALARRILRANGYTVLEASHGAEALRVSDHHAGAIDLVLTDVVMPEMSGPQVADRLRTARPNARVLFMSGYPDRATSTRRQLGDDAPFIQKPFTPNALTRAVRQVLDAPAA